MWSSTTRSMQTLALIRSWSHFPGRTIDLCLLKTWLRIPSTGKHPHDPLSLIFNSLVPCSSYTVRAENKWGLGEMRTARMWIKPMAGRGSRPPSSKCLFCLLFVCVGRTGVLINISCSFSCCYGVGKLTRRSFYLFGGPRSILLRGGR